MARPTVIVFSTAYHPFIGGAEIAIEEVSKRLKGQFDFFIVTARFRRDLPRKEVRTEGTVIRVGLGSGFDKWLLPIFGPLVAPRHAAATWGVDISQGSLAAALCKFLRPQVPFIFNIQYGYGEERLGAGRLGLIGLAFRYMLRQADYVTAISSYLLGLARRYGYEGPAEVIHNGVDVERFKNVKARDKNAKVVITTSRLVPKNGVDTLIEAIAEVKKEMPNIRCNIVGDGPERESLTRKVRGLALEKNVGFFGSVPHGEVPRYLHEADVFVRPSRSEGMGSSFVEALAAGLPIIGTPVEGVRDIIQDKKTGLFAKVDDPKDLAKKIELLLREKGLAQAIVENGQKMVSDKFSWDKIAERYARIFLLPHALKILIATPLYPPDIGGPATYSKLLADELPHKGVSVKILSFGEVRHLPKLVRHFAYFGKVLTQGRGVDLIFAQDPVSVGFPSALASLVLRKKFILKIVGDYAWEQGVQRFGVKELLDDFLSRTYGFSIGTFRTVQRFTALQASCIITPSSYLKSVVTRWGISKEKIRVIPNAFEGERVEIAKEEARKILNLSGTVAVSSGRLVPWKGFEKLIEIVPKLRTHIPDFALFIIGSGPQEKHLRRKIKELHLERAVFLVGSKPRRELFLYLKAGDVFVLNAGYEGFPHILLEAMAMEIPVVTTRIGGNSELVDDGVDGILVRYGNAEELGSAILRLIQDETLRRNLAGRAREKVAYFSKEKMISETLGAIQTL